MLNMPTNLQEYYHNPIDTSTKITKLDKIVNLNNRVLSTFTLSNNEEIIIHKNQSSIFDFIKPKQTTIYDFLKDA